MRKRVIIEEPYCRACIANGTVPPRRSVVADHIRPKAEGGGSEHENYQGLCWPCSKAKTAKESARARRRNAS